MPGDGNEMRIQPFPGSGAPEDVRVSPVYPRMESPTPTVTPDRTQNFIKTYGATAVVPEPSWDEYYARVKQGMDAGVACGNAWMQGRAPNNRHVAQLQLLLVLPPELVGFVMGVGMNARVVNPTALINSMGAEHSLVRCCNLLPDIAMFQILGTTSMDVARWCDEAAWALSGGSLTDGEDMLGELADPDVLAGLMVAGSSASAWFLGTLQGSVPPAVYQRHILVANNSLKLVARFAKDALDDSQVHELEALAGGPDGMGGTEPFFRAMGEALPSVIGEMVHGYISTRAAPVGSAGPELRIIQVEPLPALPAGRP